MEVLKERTIGQIVAADYRTAHIFNKYNIDFCCGGEKTVEDVCAKSDIQYDELISELEGLSSEGAAEENYNNWSLDFLADYIINNHHNKTREVLPELKFYAQKVAKVHGSAHEELIDMNKEVVKLANEMIQHMDEEEEKVFPYIKSLVLNDSADYDKDHSSETIAMMQDEHDETGAMMKNIRKLSNDYTLPDDACPTYRVYFENLAAFEKDLYKHVHLENNILFPKALELNE